MFIRVEPSGYIFDDIYDDSILFYDDMEVAFKRVLEWEKELGDTVKPVCFKTLIESKAMESKNLIYLIDDIFYKVLYDGLDDDFLEIIESFNYWEQAAFTDWAVEFYELESEAMEFFIKSAELKELLAYFNYLGYKVGTVWDRDWSPYIAWPGTCPDYIDSIWEGRNFYDVALIDNDGVVADSICNCYLPTGLDLFNFIELDFGLERDSYLLVSNSGDELYFDDGDDYLVFYDWYIIQYLLNDDSIYVKIYEELKEKGDVTACL